MAELAEEDLERLFRLCRLAYTEEEKKSALDGIAKILRYVEQLASVPTDGLPTYVFPLSMSNLGREDLENDPNFPPLARDEFLKSAPAATAGMVRVPPVLTP